MNLSNLTLTQAELHELVKRLMALQDEAAAKDKAQAAARAAGVDVGIGVGEDASDTEVAAKKITQVRTSRKAALL